MTETQQLKDKAIQFLKTFGPQQADQLRMIDERLMLYYDDLILHSGTELGDDNDWHCLMELLGALKFLRLLRTYIVDRDKVQQVLRLREGEWHKEGNIWKYDSGGLLVPGRSGETHYRWENFQVFIWAAIFGLRAWVDTEVPNGTRELLPTEREGKNGTIEDLRRICTDFTLYGPRKIDKTGISAYAATLFFMLEDADAQIMCCANAADQSKILYRRAFSMIHELDPRERRIRFTASETNWRHGQMRSASMTALTAGGKTKDGLFAQLCCADEYGSAAYVNGASDMGALVSVVQSSMGPRREPLTLTTTTAGNISQGPFIDKLEGIKQSLIDELDRQGDTDNPDGILLSPDDRTMCLILEPDEWERDEEYMLTSRILRRKINPMLGKIVQHSFYDSEITASRSDPQKKIETLTKLLNVYQTGKAKDWIKPDEIRSIQIPMRIDDCTADQGWEVMVGSDFSKGDDLNGNSYLAKRWRSDLREMEYFADLDAYMSEAAVNNSPIRELLLKWAADGWLHIVPGKTFDPAIATNRIIELDSKGVNFFGFGYDPYNAKTVINALTQWLVDIGLDPKQLIKPVRQNFATYSPAVDEFDYMIHRGIQLPNGKVEPNPQIHLSMNPLWPWEFGNTILAESNDGMENMKPVKATASGKVDNVQMLLSALILHDAADAELK